MQNALLQPEYEFIFRKYEFVIRHVNNKKTCYLF